MFNAITLLFLFLFFGKAWSHYLFAHLLVNDTQSSEFQYVRNVTKNETYIDVNDDWFGMTYPLSGKDLESTNFTCGRDAIKSAQTTQTATIVAGDQVGFRLASIPIIPKGWRGLIFHEGPAHIYMSKAPDHGLETYLGDDADWFKIAQFYARNSTRWILDKPYVSDINFTIPQTTPPGEYLLRVEQFSWNPYLQFYVNCAHVSVVGPGGGSPSEFAKFPGTYNYTSLRKDDWYSKDRTTYPGLGPAVWKG